MSYYNSLDNAGIAPLTITAARGQPLSRGLYFIGADYTGETFTATVTQYAGADATLATLTAVVSDVDLAVTYQSLVDNTAEYCGFKSSHIPDCKAATDTVDVTTLLITAEQVIIESITENNPIAGADTVLNWSMSKDSNSETIAAGYFKLTGV